MLSKGEDGKAKGYVSQFRKADRKFCTSVLSIFSLIFFIFFRGGIFFLMNMVYYCDNSSKHSIALPMCLDIAQGAHIC